MSQDVADIIDKAKASPKQKIPNLTNRFVGFEALPDGQLRCMVFIDTTNGAGLEETGWRVKDFNHPDSIRDPNFTVPKEVTGDAATEMMEAHMAKQPHALGACDIIEMLGRKIQPRNWDRCDPPPYFNPGTTPEERAIVEAALATPPNLLEDFEDPEFEEALEEAERMIQPGVATGAPDPIPPVPASNGVALCPVCGGSGLVPHGFYNGMQGEGGSSNTASEQCRSCGGTGIIRL